MSYNRFYIPTTEVSGIATQIGYRRKKVSVVVTKGVTLHNLNWDEGTKNVYHALDIGSGNLALARACQVHQMFNEHEGAQIVLRPGVAITQTGIFRGKDSMMSLYVHPDNLPQQFETYRGELTQ